MNRALLIPLSLLAGAALTAAEPDVAFARDIGGKLRRLVYDAAAIDPATGAEDRATRDARRREHARLDAWFTAKGRDIGPHNCRSEADKANLLVFRQVMADHEFLKLSYAQRRRFLKEVDAYAERLARDFAAATRRLFVGAAARKFLRRRLQQRLTFKLRYYGRQHGRTIAAMYLPRTQEVLINLDRMRAAPAAFFDSFEHELWHHLLPPDLARPGKNPWFEGFNEGLTECWAAGFYQGRQPAAGRTVEYPIITAWASLAIALDRDATVTWLAGVTASREYLARLRQQGALGRHLAGVLAGPARVTPAQRKRMETILTHWGWKEDDRSPISLGRYLVDDVLREDLLRREFRRQKDFFDDLIRVKTIVHLQDLKAALTVDVRHLKLPSNLAFNLKRVLKYVDQPENEYGK